MRRFKSCRLRSSFFFCSSPSWGKDGWLLRPMDEIRPLEKTKAKKEKNFEKKRKKNIIATKIHHLLVRTSRKEVRERSLSLSSSLSRKSRSVSFPRFLDARKRVDFPAFFFSRARPHTPHARVVGRLPAQKEQKKTRKIIAPTGTRATRLADSTRAKRGERMRSNPFFLSFGFETVSMYGWVPASVEASSS